ncbi:Ldh family oxidoreductase [Tessaracoccus terricola]
MATVEADALTAWTTAVLESWGHPGADARFIADTLVDANLRGIDSHGVLRLPAYRERVDAGLVLPDAKPEVTADKAVVHVDGRQAAGQVVAREAMLAVAATARSHGVASAVVRSSAHFGAAGYYARQLAREGFVAIVVSNSEPVVVPFGGRDPLLGTNPFAFAAPHEPHPLCVDMATATSAMGRVMVKAEAGEAIPPDWGIDADGHPTTDPGRVVSLLPFGGPKGYGMGMLVETLAGVFSGAAIGSDVGNMYADFSKPQNSGHWMLALDVEQHLPLAEFLTRMALLTERAHAVRPAPGSAGVQVPGEPEDTRRAQRLAEGIPVPDSVVAELDRLGAAIDRPLPTN